MKNLKRVSLAVILVCLLIVLVNTNVASASNDLLTVEGDVRNGGSFVFAANLPQDAKISNVTLILYDKAGQHVTAYDISDKAVCENGLLSFKYQMEIVPENAYKSSAAIVAEYSGSSHTIVSGEVFLEPQLFTDVTNKHWAFDQITELAKDKVISGYPDGTFRPDAKVSREEFAQMLVSVLGLTVNVDGQSSFVDVKSDYWASPAIEAVKSYLPGFKNPDGTYSFRGTTPILREDVATAIVRVKGFDQGVTVDTDQAEKMFKDYLTISPSLRKYIVLAVNNQAMSGYPDQTFRGQQPLTRAEVAVLLCKLKTLGDGNKVIIE